MTNKPANRVLFFFFLFMICASKAFAQPALPDMVGVTQRGVNILSWTCQYDGIKSIAVQRSADSTYNYATIGYVKNLKKGPQAFIDGHPNPGKNWYRLYIVFNSDLTWYGNRMKLFVDSTQLLQQKVMPSNDSLQKLAGKVIFNDTAGNAASPAADKPVLSLTIPDATGLDAYAYIKSQYVFTNPFTGHVNVELPEPRKHKYSLLFFDQKNKQVLEIPRMLEESLIIDKRNFQRKGIYRFELDKDDQKLETGYITIY